MNELREAQMAKMEEAFVAKGTLWKHASQEVHVAINGRFYRISIKRRWFRQSILIIEEYRNGTWVGESYE